MMAISVLVGTLIAHKRAEKFGVKPDTIYDLVIVIVVAAIVGSRAFYVIFNLDEFRGQWLDIINPFHGQDGFGIAGLSMMGGVTLVVISIIVYTLVKKLSFPLIGDVVAPTFLLGAGITRIGCFLNGCCFGHPTTCWCGIHFPNGAAGGYLQQYLSQYPDSAITGLIPTQLMASALGFILFFTVLLLERWRSFPGYTSWLVLGLYSLDRFFVDQFRHFQPNDILGHIGHITFTANEIILALLFVFSAIMFIIGFTKVKAQKR